MLRAVEEKGAKRVYKEGHTLLSRKASTEGAEISTPLFMVLVGNEHHRETHTYLLLNTFCL